MTNAYVYRAALYCGECIQKVKGQLHAEGVKPSQDDVLAYQNYDSDDYPHGPYPDGGGEADAPQHCDACGLFLENPLTDDGRDYVRDYISDDTRAPWGDPAIVKLWADFYGSVVHA